MTNPIAHLPARLRQLLWVGVLVSAFGFLSGVPLASAQKKSQSPNPYVDQALSKLDVLQSSMDQARNRSIDVTREETVVWFANEFLKYADWDEQNHEAVAYLFEQYIPYSDRKEQLAAEIPDFQRKKIVEMLDEAIIELDSVLSGATRRRPVNKVNWQNIEVGDNVLLSNGKPIFLYDYFSKTVGRRLTDSRIYNDYLGAIFHGGQNLYPPEHDRAINSFLLKEDRTFDAELLSKITEIPNTNVGFLIYWMQGIPKWIENQEPEVRFGRSSFTGFDIDNPLIREVWGTIARETGKLTQGKKVTQLGYILANEPHWHSVSTGWTRKTGEMQQISSYTLAGFREWLRKKYDGNIQTLNTNWKSTFAGFDSVQIEIPIAKTTRGTPMFYDWARYSMDRSIRWYSHLQSELRKGNPQAQTHIKNVTHFYSSDDRAHGIDLEALTRLTSMIGDDAKAWQSRRRTTQYPEPWEATYAYCWEEIGMAYDFMESVSPNKIHINSESHFLSSVHWRKLDTPVSYVKSVYWLATLQGMDANFAWFWARDPDGSPEDRLEGDLNFGDLALAGSFAGSINHQPHIANAYTQVMYDLNSFSEEIIALRKQRRALRLFHSETSAINKKKHMTHQFELYEQFFFEGINVGFATENIINTQDNRSWDAIIVYQTEFVTEAELAALQAVLDQGGTVIVDSKKSLAKNEYGHPHRRRLSSNAGQLVYLKGNPCLSQIRDFALQEIEASRPQVTLTENNGSDFKGCRWQTVQRDDGSHLVSILNLSKHDAQVTLGLKNQKDFSITNLFTDITIDRELTLPSSGVLLLQITPQ